MCLLQPSEQFELGTQASSDFGTVVPFIRIAGSVFLERVPSFHSAVVVRCYPVLLRVRPSFHRYVLILPVSADDSASTKDFIPGLESYAHSIDRTLAPITLGFCLKSIYTLFGFPWMTTSLLPIACLVFSGVNSKRGNYSAFVLWHSLWHMFGVGSIMFCFFMNKS